MTIEIFNDCIKKLDNWLVEAKQSSMEGKEVFFFVVIIFKKCSLHI